jgi:hypothetical protein
VIQKLAVFAYRWGEDEWQGNIKDEWESFVRFRTAEILPYGLKRKGKRLRPSSLTILQDSFFSALFGTWSAIKNSVLTIDPRDVTFAYLLFPRLFHVRLEVASAWSEEAEAGPFVSDFDIHKLSDVRSMLDPETGWLTQSPSFADRLRPVLGKNGEEIVSQAQIDWAKSNWLKACKKARDEYGHLRKSHPKSTMRRRNPHESILSILKMENPLLAFQMLCLGLQHEIVELRSCAHACLIRDQVLIGIMVQCAFRNTTLIQIDINHLTYDEERRTWRLSIPRHFFKNENGPFFVSPNKETRDYERDLIDQYGLYDALEAYFGWARNEILAGTETNALLVSAPRRTRRKTRGLRVSSEVGRFARGAIASLLKRITARHLGFKPITGKGIEGIKGFSVHAFRHILATGILKLSKSRNPWQEAADAIHDGEEVVRKNYARYVPRDREDDLMKTLRSGFAPKPD